MDLRLTEPSSFDRFRLGEIVGEGADLQAFLAKDLHSGGTVVVKRPHPSLVSRDLHDDVERRMRAQARLRWDMGDVGALPRLVTVVGPDRFAQLFGDDPGCPYTVLVEERARGVPLIGSVADQVRGHPVALPMNLFALHPPPRARGRSPAMEVLDVIERCAERGYVARDLGARNVFYAPDSAKTTVIDLGNLVEPRMATRRREGVDVNDALLEFFASYTTPHPTPTAASRYTAIRETPLSGRIERRARALSDEFGAHADGRQREAAAAILDRIGRRGYVDISDFRADFLAYANAANEVARWDDAVRQARREALEWLRAPYWGKFALDREGDLA